MNNITIGQYVPGNSWIYKMDPRMKILLTTALIVLIFIIPSSKIITMLIALGVFVVIFLTTRIPVIKALKGIKPVLYLLIFTLVLQVIFTKGNDESLLYTFDITIGLWQMLIIIGLIVIYALLKKYIPLKFIFFLLIVFLIFLSLWNNPFGKFEWGYLDSFKWYQTTINVYEEGLLKSGFIAIRIILMISITSLLTFSTMSMDINNGLEWILSPLKLLKVPVGVFTMLISLTLRFVPTLINESQKIMASQASRGVDFNDSKLKGKISQIVSLLVPMFVVSFKKADELSNAMEARGYIIDAKRTNIDKLRFKFIDFFALLIVVLMFVVVIFNKVGII